MKELIPIHNQGPELRADSRDVAKLFGVEHENLRDLIDKNLDYIGQLGVFRFETGKPLKGSSGGRPEKFCYLNFDQVAYLLTVSHATEKTKEFRLKLIVAFRDARNRLRPVDHALLTIPDEWRKTFPDSFYVALLKLYGDTFSKEENRPSWVGNWTNRFVYEPLYRDLPNELKKRRSKLSVDAESAEYLKLHQFIEKHAKKNLDDHITSVTTLLKVATSKQHFLELFAAAFYGQTQLLLPGEFQELSRKYGDSAQ